MKNSRPKSKEHGVAMVSTLIILSVLAIVAVALMQSVTTDRTSARSGADYYKAQLAADAGAAVGRAMLADLIRRYPDSVTGWQNIGGLLVYGTDNEATVLYARAQSGNTSLGASPAAFGPDVTLLAQPLVSRIGANASSVATNLLPLADVVSSVPFVVGTSVNINATNASRTDPFVGSRSSTNPGGALVAPVTAAQWIYLTNPSGQTNARFAFWMEDESFKVNVNIATDGPRGTTSLGTNAGEARVDGAWGVSSNSAITNANFADLAALRGNNPYPINGNIPSPLTAMLAAGISDTKAAAEVKFLTTTHSAGLDLSRGGFPRFNLNSVTNGDKRTGLNRIIAAITNTNASPLFGQRFYRLENNTNGINNATAVTANHAATYLNKIAANIYDYLDADDQPTVINIPTNTTDFTISMSNFTLRTGPTNEPILGLGGGEDGPNTVAAFGVENGPRLQEFGYHVRIKAMSWDLTNKTSKTNYGFSSTASNRPTEAYFKVSIDYYFEFYNPGTKNVTNTSAFVQLHNLPKFTGPTSGGLANERSLRAEIANEVFPAGEVVVFTTAPPGEVSFSAVDPTKGFMTNLGNLRYLTVPDTERVFEGITTTTNTNPTFNGFDRFFGLVVEPKECKGQFLMGNDQGILESHVGLPFNARTNGADKFEVANPLVLGAMGDPSSAATIIAGNNVYVRAGGLRGNIGVGTPAASEGDPRALLEQLEFLNFGETSNYDQTRFYSSMNNDTDPLGNGQTTLGRLNTPFVDASKWMDKNSAWKPDATNAPLYVRNAAMQSIGELGHITDPARVMGNSGKIELARGGGRTLRVGQPEWSSTAVKAWFDGRQTNASRTWTSWRLADIFTVRTRVPNTNVTLPGLLNPNGALRDNGAAMKAALYGLTFLPTSDTNGGAALIGGRSANVTNVVTNVIGRLTNATAAGLPANSLNPFWERGELSELSGLNSASASTVVPSQVMSNVIDRGREELIRRSVEMITPRGSVFTVYAIGQTLQVAGNKTNVLSTVRLKQTFELTPQFPTSDVFNDTFDPSPTRISRRFAAPTNYTARTISSSYD